MASRELIRKRVNRATGFITTGLLLLSLPLYVLPYVLFLFDAGGGWGFLECVLVALPWYFGAVLVSVIIYIRTTKK